MTSSVVLKLISEFYIGEKHIHYGPIDFLKLGSRYHAERLPLFQHFQLCPMYRKLKEMHFCMCNMLLFPYLICTSYIADMPESWKCGTGKLKLKRKSVLAEELSCQTSTGCKYDHCSPPVKHWYSPSHNRHKRDKQHYLQWRSINFYSVKSLANFAQTSKVILQLSFNSTFKQQKTEISFIHQQRNKNKLKHKANE